MEIDRAHIAWAHRRQILTFASRVRTREIHAEVISQHEPHNRLIQISLRPNADSYYNCRIWFESTKAGSGFVQDCNAEDLRRTIAVAMIDVWDFFDNFLRQPSGLRRGNDVQTLVCLVGAI